MGASMSFSEQSQKHVIAQLNSPNLALSKDGNRCGARDRHTKHTVHAALWEVLCPDG